MHLIKSLYPFCVQVLLVLVREICQKQAGVTEPHAAVSWRSPPSCPLALGHTSTQRYKWASFNVVRPPSHERLSSYHVQNHHCVAIKPFVHNSPQETHFLPFLMLDIVAGIHMKLVVLDLILKPCVQCWICKRIRSLYPSVGLNHPARTYTKTRKTRLDTETMCPMLHLQKYSFFVTIC